MLVGLQSFSVAFVGRNEKESFKNDHEVRKVRFRLNHDERTTDGKESQATTTTEPKTPAIGRSYADVARRASREIGVVSKGLQRTLLTL